MAPPAPGPPELFYGPCSSCPGIIPQKSPLSLHQFNENVTCNQRYLRQVGWGEQLKMEMWSVRRNSVCKGTEIKKTCEQTQREK